MTSSLNRLTRRADRLCSDRGWEVVRTLRADQDEIRRLVVTPESSLTVELVLRAETEDAVARAHAEGSALRAVASEHVVRLLEVVPVEHRIRRPAIGRRGQAPPDRQSCSLLIEHPAYGDLRGHLARRGTIRLGEAVTLLLAVADGLRALHDAGWTHGSLTTDRVMLRRDGCPVIADLRWASVADRETVAVDRAAYRGVAEDVSRALRAHEGMHLLATLHRAFAVSGWRAVSSALVELAEPEAVQVERAAVPRSAPPAAADAAADIAVVPRAGAIDESAREKPRWDRTSLARRLVDGHPVAELGVAVKAWASRRKRLLIIAAVPLAGAGLVLALIPPSGAASSGRPSDASRVATSTSSTSPSPPSPPSSGVATPDRPAAATGTAGPKAGEAANGIGTGARSDDPAVAGAALLDERHSCFAAAHPERGCLARSIEAGSAFLETEASALGTEGAAHARDYRGAVLALDQRWGDAALVVVAPGPESTPSATTQPASLLMIRSEAGWLLREVYS
ncbi:hypothetical protein ACFVWR_15340 [Leifsonia sp. NPDC058292]|uniref:hypothetical protein n=1 Tax=Leifsonia sp. NPDC058292 TaxID=3346428 RepID=UPI0036DE2D20